MNIAHKIIKTLFRQKGGATAEFLISVPALLLLGLGGLQTLFFYDAKTTLTYATFEAAREGAVSHAQTQSMRNELGVRLSPIFGGDGSATEALESMAESTLEVNNLLFTKIEVLNPTREAFDDFGVNNPANGKRELPNDNLKSRSRAIGAKSGVNIQDANLLKVKVTYGYELKVPVINKILPAILKWTDPGNIAYYLAGRMPMSAVATVRMQSAAWPDDNAPASGGGSVGATPPNSPNPGEAQPTGGDPDEGDSDTDDDGGDSGSGDGSGDDEQPGDDTGDVGTGDETGDSNPGDPGNGSTDCTDAGESSSTGTTTGLPGLSVGNPINVTNGNKYQREPDLNGLSGALPLYFTRHYNSRGQARGVLGYGWRHSFELSLRVSEERIELIQSDGRLLRFDASDEEGGERRYLGRLAADGEMIADAQGYLWRQPEGKRLRFNTAGRLQEILWRGKHLRLRYDGNGRLRQVSDSQERHLGLEYDAKGRLAAITGPAGGQTRYHYDKHNNLQSVRRADGTSRRYHYEELRDRHALTGITDERGIRYASWRYDAEGRAIRSSHADHVEEVHLDYTTAGQTRVTDSQGRISTYLVETRDGIGHVLAIQGPGCSSCGGGDVSYRYNERHQVIERRSKEGITHHYHYDELGRTTEITRQVAGEAPQRLLSYRYDGRHRRPASVIRPSVNRQGEHRLEVRYNAAQQPIELSERGYRPQPEGGYSPIERTTRLSYDKAGNLTQIDGPRDDVADLIGLAYDAKQRLQALTTPDGRTLRVAAYDDAGRPLKIQASGQQTLRLAYDERGNLSEVAQGDRTIRYDYDRANQLVGLTDADGQQTRIEYDAAGRATALESAAGRLETELDREGRPVRRRISGPNGDLLSTVSYLYDAQGRLSARREADKETRYHYSDGQLQAIEDPAGNLTELSYNGLGQLLAITQPEQRVTRIDYDAAGQAIGLTDPRYNTSRQLKDDFGRIVSRQHPDTGTTRYEHDPAGNLIAKTDPQGRTTAYHYDAANRLIEERGPVETTHLSYDPESGRLASLSDSQSREQFVYDKAGRLIEHTRELDVHRFTTGYAYDSAGRLSQKTLPDGQRLDYHYYRDGERKGQLRAITRGGILGMGATPLLGEIDQDKRDGETGLVFGNGIHESRTYDARGRTKAIRHNRQLQLQYRYDEQGRISDIDLDGMIQRYAYDAWGRLSQAETKLGDYRYTYDQLGNRTEKAHTSPDGETRLEQAAYPEAGQGNRLLSQGNGEARDYHYNASGSPERIGQRRYEYNAQQRPVKVFQSDAEGSETLLADYSYNRFGERIKKVVYSNTKRPKVTYYLYDGHQLSAEANEAGQITAQYLYLNERPVTKLEGERAYAIHTDHLGAPRAVTDDAQHPVWQADYSPFGLIDLQTRQITLNLRLPGQYEDEETGTYYNYHRDYDPNTGRYLTSDPIGLKGGLNTYAYVSGDPLNGVDPLGLRAWRRAVVRYREPTLSEHIANYTVPSIVRDIRENYDSTFLYQTIGPPNSGYRNEDYLEVSRIREAYRMIEAIQQYEPTFAPPKPRAGLFNAGDMHQLEMRLEVMARLNRLRQIGYLGFEYDNKLSYSIIDIAQLDRVIDNYNDGMCSVVLPQHQFMNIELLEDMLKTYDVFISPEGIPFPGKESYNAKKLEYEDYRAKGGNLSFMEWVDQGMPEAGSTPNSGGYTVSPSRREHILEGDGPGTGTGHGPNRGNTQGTPPDTWTDDQFINAIERVANGPNSRWRQSTGPGYTNAPVTVGGPASDAPTQNNQGNPIRFKVRGRDHGITIEVIVEPGAGGIITGYRIPDNIVRW
jgi:RHS repeat-associated protein